MRISTHELFMRSMDNFTLQQSLINQVQEQIASGKKMLVPSDNPIGMMQALNYHYQFNKDEQFIKNANTAQSQLEYEESVLENVNRIYHRFKELTIAAGAGSLSNTDRESIVSEMQERLYELVSLANTRSSNGNYLFAGFNLTEAPVQRDLAGNYQYHGDSGQANIMLGESTNVLMTDHAKEIFFTIPSAGLDAHTYNGTATVTSASAGLVNAGTLTALQSNDLSINNILINHSISDSVSSSDVNASALAIANAINNKYEEHGVRAYAQPNVVSLGIFTPGVVTGSHFTVNGEPIIDLLGTEITIQDAINAKTAITGVSAAQPGGAGTAIVLTAADGRNIQLQTDGTSLATFVNFDLTTAPLDQVQRAQVTLTSHHAIEINGATPSNAGFNYGVTTTSVNTGTGVLSDAHVVNYDAEQNTAYSIVFGAGGTTYSIYDDSNPGTPLGGFSNVSYLSGEAITFAGVSVTISGTPNAGDSFGVQLPEAQNQSVFATFQRIIDKIRSVAYDPAQLSYEIGTGISNIDNAEAQLLNIRAQIGARLNIIESQINYHQNLKITTQKSLSQVEDVDYSRVITQLSEYSFTLQAAQQSFVKVQSLSLFYFIR